MDYTHLSSLFTIGFISLLAAISPGPDFIVVVRNNLLYSRKAGMMTAFGVALGLLVHLAYTLVGIGMLIVESPFLYNLIKYSGAGYLVYLGLSGVISSFKKGNDVSLDYAKSTQTISSMTALRQGFLTNALNPKAAMFFISLFSQFISPETSVILRIEYAAVTFFVGLGWFVFLSYLLTAKFLTGKVDRFRCYVDRVMGSFLMALGIKLLY